MELKFEDFCMGYVTEDPARERENLLCLRSPDADIGGGRITFSDIDVLARYPEMRSVRIMGLSQDTFEYFIKTYGRQLRSVSFFKNKRVEDWSLLGTLPDLEYVFWFWNQKIDKLWDMSGNLSLKGLCIKDFTRMPGIEGISRAPALKFFSIGNAVWDKYEADSFLPLAGSGVSHLSFNGRHILDGNLGFLEKMPELERFFVSAKEFTTEQTAWAAANFPRLGKDFQAKHDGQVLSRGEFCPGAFISGRGKPNLTYEKNAARIRYYVEEFEKLKNRYRGLSYAEAFGSSEGNE